MKNNCGWEDCFTCPYPDCIQDTGIRKGPAAKKRRAIELDDAGMWPKEIAITLGVSKRSVERYLKEQVRNKQDYILSKYKEG